MGPRENLMSEKSVAQKLQIREGHKLLIINPPKGYKESLAKDVSKSVVFLKEAKTPANIIQVFVTSNRELGEQLAKLKPLLSPNEILWVTYPKGASKIKADINRDIIREIAPSFGLEAVAIFSVNEDWSALRLKLG